MASKRRKRRQACTSKLAYDSYQAARAAAIGTAKTFGGDITPYKCRFCGKFHVGHTPGWVRRIIRARRGW